MGASAAGRNLDAELPNALDHLASVERRQGRKTNERCWQRPRVEPVVVHLALKAQQQAQHRAREVMQEPERSSGGLDQDSP